MRLRQNDRLDKLIFFKRFTAVSQQQRESIKCTRLEEHQNIWLTLVYFVNYLVSSQPFLQGETREPHTKTIYSAWNASKTNIGHLLNKRCQWWRGGAQKTLSVKNYRVISHNGTTHRKEVASHCRSPNSGSTSAETRRVSSAATSRLSRWTKTDWLDEEGPPGCICSAVMLDSSRQVEPPGRWETSRVWVSSGLRCKPLNDSPVVFNNNLVALLQLFVLRSGVHLTHVGHQLLRAEALLHLRQLPLILLHRVGPTVWLFQRLVLPLINWRRTG